MDQLATVWFIMIALFGVWAAIIRIAGFWSIRSLCIGLLFLGFGVRGVVLGVGGGEGVYKYVGISDDLIAIQFAALAATMVMAAAMAIAGGAGRSVDSDASLAATAMEYRTPRLTAAFVLVLLVQAGLFTLRFDGFGRAVDALSRRSLTGEPIGAIANLTMAAIPLAALAVFEAERSGYRRNKRLAWVAVASAAPWIAIINGRAMVISLLWAVALSIPRRPRNSVTMRRLALGVGAAILVVVGGLAWRQSRQFDAPFSEALTVVRGDTLSVASESLPLTDHLAVGIAYSDAVGHDGGSSWLDAFSVLVPREVWSSKPVYLPLRIANEIGGSRLSGAPAGLLGEGFIAAGWVGLGCYATMFGLVVGAVDRARLRARLGGFGYCWLSATATTVVLGGIRTGAQGAAMTMQIALVYAVIPWAGARWARKRVTEGEIGAGSRGRTISELRQEAQGVGYGQAGRDI